MAIDISQYRDLYLKTARDLVTTMEQQINHLTADTHDKKTVYEIYRSAHSLKSQSLVMGYSQLGFTNRIIEALFREIFEGKKTLTNEILSLIKKVVIHIKKSIDKIQNNNQEADLNEDMKKLQMYISIEK